MAYSTPEVLLVENSITDAALVKEYLSGLGCRVTHISTCTEAYDVISLLTFPPKYKLVIIDVMLDKCLCFDVIQRITANAALDGTPIAVMTGASVEMTKEIYNKTFQPEFQRISSFTHKDNLANGLAYLYRTYIDEGDKSERRLTR